MQLFFSTDGADPKKAFRRWQEVICDQVGPARLESLAEDRFQGRIDVACIGTVPIAHLSHAAMRTEATAEMVRRHGSHDHLYAVLRLSGQGIFQQGNREARTQAGDLVVLDARPAVSMLEASSSLVLELPRARLETMLGSSSLFSALTVGAELPSAALVSAYFRELVRVGDQFTPDAAARMASVGIDLIVASLAERMAQDLPRATHGTVTVQRARAYVEANLGDQTLDPAQLAAAMGVSLRRLQELFQEQGRHIADYIWERRLEVAAMRLIDPACAHLSIGLLAHGCGFGSQAHFARRFKERHGLTPTEFRQASGQGPRGAARRGRPARVQGRGWQPVAP